MSMLGLCQWLANTDFATALRGSSWVYPIVLTSHLVVLALFGGMLLMSDLRLLGFALTEAMGLFCLMMAFVLLVAF